MRKNLLRILPILVLITLFLFFSLSFLLEIPVVTNDEALIADISLNLLKENRIGTDLWKELLNGVENHAYWIPPVFFYTNALWFKVTGFGLQNLRLLSVIFGAVFIFIFYRINNTLLNPKSPKLKTFLLIATSLLLLTDSIFLRGSRTGRPEMMVLLLAIISLFFYLKIINEKSSKMLRPELIFTGIFLGLAIVTHMIAISFAFAVVLNILIAGKINPLRNRKFWLVSIILIIPFCLWIISIYPNFNLLKEQLLLVSASRDYSVPWYTTVSLNPSYPVRINYFLYIIISVIFIWQTIWNRKGIYILLSLILISTWTFATLGKIYWYTVYPIPFIYLALAILTEEKFQQKLKKNLDLKLKKIAWISIFVILLGSNLIIYFGQSKNNSYKTFAEQILKIIPENKTIYISALPDAYFILNNQSLAKLVSNNFIGTTGSTYRNNMHEWPVLQTSKENHLKILNDSDYVITAGYHEPSLYLYSYLEQNTLTTQDIQTSYGLIQIIQLKDKTDRKSVD